MAPLRQQTRRCVCVWRCQFSHVFTEYDKRFKVGFTQSIVQWKRLLKPPQHFFFGVTSEPSPPTKEGGWPLVLERILILTFLAKKAKYKLPYQRKLKVIFSETTVEERSTRLRTFLWFRITYIGWATIHTPGKIIFFL